MRRRNGAVEKLGLMPGRRVGRSVVATANNTGYRNDLVKVAITRLFDQIEPRLQDIVKPGDRVFVKPTVRHGSVTDPAKRLTSHPAVVRAVIESVIDCGGIVSFGDEGAKSLTDSPGPHVRWLREIARRTGARLVNFRQAGVRELPGLHIFSRPYPISLALLETNHIINCANLQPHNHLLLAGAIKNMFNAVIGKRQNILYQLNRRPKDLARVVVDVFERVEPTLSILDLTTVHEVGTDHSVRFRPAGVILASTDSVALDAIAAWVVGCGERRIWTTYFASRRGLGHAGNEEIEVRGPGASEPRLRLKLLAPPVAQKAKVYDRLSSYLSHTVLRPRPVVDPGSCVGCGDCVTFCPTGAIEVKSDKLARIERRCCIECAACIDACGENAIQMQPSGINRVARSIASSMRLN